MIRILNPRDPHNPNAIDTTSRSRTWSQGLSPFLLGPCPLYEGAPVTHAQKFENLWQYAKVYSLYVGPDDKPTEPYFHWARGGFEKPRGERYPMGKGSKPEFSWWAGEALGYVEARKKIYIPSYARAVIQTEAWNRLLSLYREKRTVTLWDFDGYDHHAEGMTLKDVANNPNRNMGHAFVLAMLLEKFV